MIGFIKSIFAKENDYVGQLYIQNKNEGKITIKYMKNTLEFVFAENKNIIVNLKHIKDLEILKEEVVFNVDNKKYKIQGKNIVELFNKIHPLIYDTYLFKGNNIAYYIYNKVTGVFEQIEKIANIKIYFDNLYYMRIENKDSILHFEEINTNLQYYIDEKTLSFVWCTFSIDQFYTFSIQFSDSLMFLEFRSKFVEYVFKSNNAEGNYKYYSGIGDMVIEDEPVKLNDDELTDLKEYSDETNEIKVDTKKIDNDSFNKHLIVGKDLCFVTRGSSLGVFDLNNENLKFRAHIENIIGNPQKIITHNGDRNLLVLNEDDKTHLDLIDLEKGEVIEKWDINEGVNDYFNSMKYENASTLIGVSDKALFRIDPRIKEKIVSKMEYKTKPNFVCGSANIHGNVAVASKKGDLRLYNKLDKRAKTLLPGFGDEIIGVDTNKDGSLIVSTSMSYIIVFQVNSNYAINCKDSVPRRLQLKPQHLSLINDKVSFTIAKFDQNDSIIITSTGPYIIKWEVNDILKGNIYNYSMKRLNERVMDEDFIMNGEDVIVALKNDVRKLKECNLKKPNF